MTSVYICRSQFIQYIYLAISKPCSCFSALFSNNNTQEIVKTNTGDSVKTKAKINAQAERLLQEYGNSILRLAYSYLHNISDAEDVLQDALIQFLKNEPSFESKSHEKAWLMRVAINISKNKIKYNKVRNTDELSEYLAADEKEDLAFVWEAVKELPIRYREVVHLFYYEGYSTSQIAQMLQKNESTVRSNLHRGRYQLKEILKEVYDFEE